MPDVLPRILQIVLTLHNSHNTAIVSVTDVRKIRLREVKQLPWDPTWLHEDSESCLSDFKAVMCRQMFNDQLSLGKKKALLSCVCWLLWCEHPHPGQFPATKVITEFGRDVHEWLYGAYMSHWQHIIATAKLLPFCLTYLLIFRVTEEIWVYNWTGRDILSTLDLSEAGVWNFLLWTRK